MKKLLGVILIQLCFLIGISPALIAQDELDKSQIYGKIGAMVDEAIASLPDKSDPYGFQISIKMALKENGVLSNVLDSGTVQGIVSGKLAPHQFDKFNLGKPMVAASSPGFIYITVGLTPANAKDETFWINSQSYTLKENNGGQFRLFTVQVGAQFLIEKPNNGSILGDVYYAGKDGKPAKLTNFPFKTTDKERKVRYRRLGPGDNKANSGGEIADEECWKPFQGNESNFEIVDLTPGHYYPSVKLNGCIQKLENPDKYKEEEEIIIKTETDVRWDNPSIDQKVIIPDGVNASKVDNAIIKTTYSTGNTIEGFLLTEGQSPGKWRDHDYVKKENVQILKTETKIWLEPFGWTSNSSYFPKDTMSTDGTYKFKNVPSGVYLVYFDGQKGSGRKVEVCNCDENKEPKEADLVYQQNMRTEGYEITLDYKFNYEGESFNLKATWGNVVMAFGDENTIPQMYSLYTTPNKDSLDNHLDIEGKVIQPPFVIIDDPYYYPNCGNDYRYCSDIFRRGPMPPIEFSYSKSGPMLSQFGASPDFREDGLYNEFQAVEYKKDIVFEDGSQVGKGVYFTWQFAFDNSSDDVDGFFMSESMAASEIYDFYESEGGEIPTSHIFGTGTVDARVPDDVIEQIKKGENFSIKKTDEAVTYILTGTMHNKTATANQDLFFKKSNLLVSVYPNPTNDFIILNIEGIIETRHALSLSYQLFDMNGKLMGSNKITGNQSSIAMGGLVPANYFLKVTQGNKEIKTFKIIKH